MVSGLMTRISPLLLGVAGIGLALIGAEGYLLFRPHRRPAPAVVETPPDDDSERRPAVASPEPPRPVQALPAESAPVAPVPAVQPPQPEVEPPVERVQNAALKKRALLMANHNQRVIQEADERAFETMKLPDATRAAIRRINDGYVKTTRDFLDANPPTWSPGEQVGANLAKSDEADRARRAALKDVLGADGVSAFETAEYSAARRLRRQYSGQWAQELDQQAPLPEGLAPSPH
jgi:hypothetical protein